MSQHDFNISNQTASVTRADINNALGALATLSSGTTAPYTKYANMLWYETDTNTLWMRNEANSTWIRVAYVDQSANAWRVLDNTRVVSTSGTTIGYLAVHATSTWQSGVDTNDKLVSPAKVNAAIQALVPNVLNASGTAPLYACRAWVNFNGTGTVAIRASGNVSSITDNGVGNYTVNFTTAMADVNYAVLGSCIYTEVATQTNLVTLSPYLRDTSSVRVITGYAADTANAGVLADCNVVSVAIFR